MTPDDEALEKVARAIASASGADSISIGPRGASNTVADLRMELFREQAAAALSAMRQHDAESGMVMVPREPTPRILVAMDAVSAALSFASGRTEGNRGRYAAIITATLTAAQEATTDG